MYFLQKLPVVWYGDNKVEHTVGLNVTIAGGISETRWFPKMDINWAHLTGI